MTQEKVEKVEVKKSYAPLKSAILTNGKAATGSPDPESERRVVSYAGPDRRKARIEEGTEVPTESKNSVETPDNEDGNKVGPTLPLGLSAIEDTSFTSLTHLVSETLRQYKKWAL